MRIFRQKKPLSRKIFRPKFRRDSCGKSYEETKLIPEIGLENFAIKVEKFTICHEICEDITKTTKTKNYYIEAIQTFHFVHSKPQKEQTQLQVVTDRHKLL